MKKSPNIFVKFCLLYSKKRWKTDQLLNKNGRNFFNYYQREWEIAIAGSSSVFSINKKG